MKKIYEIYHEHRKVQKKLINKNDFTYHVILDLLTKQGIKGKKILDIGCGVGTIDFYLVNKGASVVGIDISRNGIKTAISNQENLGIKNNLKFKIMNFPQNIPNEKFDIIVCSEVLEHIQNDKLAAKRMVGLLNKNGVIIASSPSTNSFMYKMGKLKSFDKRVGHLRRYSENDFKSLFKITGLKVVAVRKVQGIIRDFLFTNDIGGFILKIINRLPVSKIVTFLDNLTVLIFGESDIYLVVRKI